MVLLATFFGCRLVWGTYQSLRVYQDVWHIVHLNTTTPWSDGQSVTNPIFAVRDGQLCLGKESCIADQAEVMKFASSESSVPVWLCGVYLFSNLTLNALNFYWFGKMIETVRKRFEGSPVEESKQEKDRRPSIIEEAATRLDREVISGPETPYVEKKDPIAAGRGYTTGTQTDGNVGRRRQA